MRPPIWWLLPATLQTLLALGLCFTPLFNLLGYEFSLATGLLAAVTGMVVGLGAGRHAENGLRSLFSALLWSLLHLLPALAVISLNALRVRNCDYSEGLGFFLLLPVATTLYATAQGVVIARLAHGVRRWQRVAAASILLLLPLGWTLWHLYWHPPIFAYDHLWGHFAGSLYDEAVGLTPTLMVFRVGTLLRIAILAVFMWAWERRLAVAPWRLVGTAAAGVAVATAFELLAGPELGFRVSRSDIEAALPRQIERPGLVLHLPAHVDEEKAEALADEHLFRLQQLSEVLEVEVPRTIHSFVYANADQKARLMGGRATMIARPWLYEIHVHNVVSPHPIVGHELVHAVAATFGSRLLGVSARWGIGVNMTLVEGVAEALSPERRALDLDSWSRAMRDLNLAPDVRGMLGPAGFWRQSPGRAYTIAGSFVRYLIATYGAEPFKRAYPNGDFETAYGKPLDTLATEWETIIDARQLSDRERRIAEERFRRSSIFARPCAHEISQLRRRAARLPAPEAVEVHRVICEHLGNAPSARLELAMALRRAEDDEGFSKLATELIDEQGLNDVQRVRLLELRADLAWDGGDLEAARVDSERAQGLGISVESERLNWVKLWAMQLPEPLRSEVRRFLGRDLAPLAAVLRLQAARGQRPDDTTLPYLIARQLFRVDAWQQGLDTLADCDTHPFAPIAAEIVRLRAVALWRLDRLAESEAAFRAYAEVAPTSGERVRALDMAARVRWQTERSVAPAAPAD